MKDKKVSNVVTIGQTQNTEIYEHSILARMKPSVYNKFGCIKIQTISSRLEYAEVIIRRFKFAGLKEISRKKVEIEVTPLSGNSYILSDAWEIELKKIPILEGFSEDE